MGKLKGVHPLAYPTGVDFEVWNISFAIVMNDELKRLRDACINSCTFGFKGRQTTDTAEAVKMFISTLKESGITHTANGTEFTTDKVYEVFSELVTFNHLKTLENGKV